MKIYRRKTDIYGMAAVGTVKGNYEIYVNTNDGGEHPHFHYRKKNNWNEFHTCIMIESAEYFHHNGKEDVLNSDQRKELVKFLNSKVTIARYSDKFINNWELICFLWDMNNSNRLIDDATEMPDYKMLPTK